MKPTTRDRLMLPVLLPVGILVVIAAALYGFSRILLSLPATAATATALAAAAGIVVVSALAASRRQVRLSTILAMLGACAGIAMLAGGIALAVAPDEEEEEGEQERPVVVLAAFNIQFEPTSLVVPADEAFTLRFDNQDAGVQHNVEIFDNPEFSGTALFEGELITGVREVDYPVEPLAPGSYSFFCAVHPNMVGEIEAVPGGGEGGGEGGGQTVVAQNLVFDTATIELPAGVPSTITMDNRDAGVQHNIAIYTDSSLSEELFNGELIAGPASIDYEIPALEPGEYYFLCIVHPNMNGTVVVAEAAGEEPPTGGTAPDEPTGTTG